ncbi:diphthine synthase [Candidatus Woesearchaeota archaeon]|nr:diphthine synthase [Candidatus Woesearchaeota archaeon]
MALYLIGIGLDNEKDITLKGLEAVRKCKDIYLESYTSKLNCPTTKLEKLYGKKIFPADRELVEKEAEEKLLKPAKKQDIALLVIGDPMSATTHTDLLLRAKKMKIRTEVIHNASVLTAAGITGLELYKFGKTTSIPFHDKGFEPETHYDVLKGNQNMGLHTLFLLDLKPEQGRYMTVNQAIQSLLEIADKRKDAVFSKDTICIGCARLSSKNQKIISGKAEKLLKKDFGKPVHCLVVPGKLHFIEEEAVKNWK